MAILYLLLLSTLGVAFGQDDCTGVEDGVIISSSCRVYAVCENEVPVETDCWADGLVFNREIGKCDYPENTPEPCCCERDCTNKTDGSYADTFVDCKAYYTCRNGLFFGHQQCIAGTVFDEKNGICNWPSAVCPPCGTCNHCKCEDTEELDEDNP